MTNLFPSHSSKKSLEASHDRTCTDLDMLTTGDWNNDTNQWHPKNCSFVPLDKHSLDQCMANKSISFYGDSTLRNIAEQLIWLEGDETTRLKGVAGPQEQHLLGEFALANNGSMKGWWTPSAYYQRPGQVGTMDKDDYSIISIAVWDMGSYYRGINKWHLTMKNIIAEAAKKRGNRPLYVMNVHRLYPNKCILVNDEKSFERCQNCNREESMNAFRDALVTAVSCVRKDGYDNVHMIDTFGVTNSSFAEERSDAVHYDELVTSIELQVILASICFGRHHPVFENNVSMVCPENPDFESGIGHHDCIPG